MKNRFNENLGLNFFDSLQFTPRPESYREDVKLANRAPQRKSQDVYQNIGAAAESGWDFSSRWFQIASDMTTVQTIGVIPVDLNVIMLKLQRLLAKFTEITGDFVQHFYYVEKAEKRVKNILKYLYNKDASSFKDFLIPPMTSTD